MLSLSNPFTRKTRQILEALKEKNELNQEIMALLANFHHLKLTQISKEQLWLLMSPLKHKYYEDLAMKYRYVVPIVNGDITGDSSLIDGKPR